jgi:hypothetical protein
VAYGGGSLGECLRGIPLGPAVASPPVSCTDSPPGVDKGDGPVRQRYDGIRGAVMGRPPHCAEDPAQDMLTVESAGSSPPSP